MKYGKEITVKVNCSYDKLHKVLIENGFKVIEKYNMHDYYMKDKNLDIHNMHDLDILSKCILVRNLGKYGKYLLYKYKEYNDLGDIIKDGKVECKVNDVDEALAFMKIINYDILFEIDDNMTIYNNGKMEFAVQYVNNKYLFIELEEEGNKRGKKYNTIEEMKKDLNDLNLDIDTNNYFVKKAQIILNEKGD